jgi:hypothetical protein
VEKRDQQGAWDVVHTVPTRDMAGSGDTYSWVDTATNVSGQCYRIAAINVTDETDTAEQCTVRPDPASFPQGASAPAMQWDGLYSTNDSIGYLHNNKLDETLTTGNETFGVNLNWDDGSKDIQVEAQGGPNLMRGQALALKTAGGWLKYGHQDYGVDLQLSSTPSYEWYAIGDTGTPGDETTHAGEPLGDGGYFALWNNVLKAYLVNGHQTLGIDLNWYKPGDGSNPPPPPPPPPTTRFKSYQVINCTWPEQDTVGVWAKELTTGSAWTLVGNLESNWTADGTCGVGDISGSPVTFTPPVSGHVYDVIAGGRQPRLLPRRAARPEPRVQLHTNGLHAIRRRHHQWPDSHRARELIRHQRRPATRTPPGEMKAGLAPRRRCQPSLNSAATVVPRLPPGMASRSR